MYSTTIEISFSAAHFLRGYDGSCSRLHGHNWKVRVKVRTDELNDIGMSIDFFELEKITGSITAKFDHQEINKIPPFDKTLNPTSENLARYIFEEIKNKLPVHIKLASVSIGETDKYTAKYSEK